MQMAASQQDGRAWVLKSLHGLTNRNTHLNAVKRNSHCAKATLFEGLFSGAKESVSTHHTYNCREEFLNTVRQKDPVSPSMPLLLSTGGENHP